MIIEFLIRVAEEINKSGNGGLLIFCCYIFTVEEVMRFYKKSQDKFIEELNEKVLF
jgi:hypothetical protein